VLKPASTVVVDHPAIVGSRREHVLVQSGGYGWQRAPHHHW
jgi:hypothetical protein